MTYLLSSLLSLALLPASELRSYDLSMFLAERGAVTTDLSMLPYRSGYETGDHEVEWTSAWEADDVVDWLTAMVTPELWQSDELTLELTGPDGRLLLVEAPAEVQQQIGQALDWLLAATVPDQQLEVRVLTAPISTRDFTTPVTWDAAEAYAQAEALARQWSASWQTLGPLRLPQGIVAHHESVETVNVVYDWDSHLASRAAAAQPITEVVSLGDRLSVRGFSLPAGIEIDLLLRHSHLAAPLESRAVRGLARLSGPAGELQNVVAGDVQHPLAYFATVAGTFFVPTAKVLWIPIQTDTVLGPQSYVFEIKASPPPPVPAPWQVTGDGTALQLTSRSLAALLFRGIQHPPLHNRLFDLDSSREYLYSCAANLLEDRGRFDESGLEDFLQRAASPQLDEVEGARLELLRGQLFALLPPAATRAVQSFVTTQLTQRPTRTLIATLTDAAGRQRARVQSPLAAGQTISVWSGVQGSLLAGWDVEVAEQAVLGDPIFQAWVDGLALQCTLIEAPGGRSQLQLQALCHLLKSPPQKTALGVAPTPFIDVAAAQVLHVDDRRFLQPGEATVWAGEGLELRVQID